MMREPKIRLIFPCVYCGRSGKRQLDCYDQVVCRRCRRTFRAGKIWRCNRRRRVV